ncbi:dihydropyrimidinase-related protein 4 isoform X1 [Tachysurus ichikawai]
MAERKMSDEDNEQQSLLRGLGSSSPKPRVMLGGMFCSVEGAFENKTLNFESFNPSSTRRHNGSSRYSRTLCERSTQTPSSTSKATESPGLQEQTTHTPEDQQQCEKEREDSGRIV